MKQHTTKRLLAILAAFTMLFSLCIPAAAADSSAGGHFHGDKVYIYDENGEIIGAQMETTYAVPFNDIRIGDWFFHCVVNCYEAGVINGMGDGTFAPNESVTRAQAAKMIVLASGVSYDETATADFSDTSGHWAEGYIAAAAENGLMSSKGDGAFAPEETLTRAQLASLIVKAMDLTSEEGALSFPDVAESAWYYGDVAKASAAGYVQGDESGYRPEDSVKRSEFAKVICQMYLSE